MIQYQATECAVNAIEFKCNALQRNTFKFSVAMVLDVEFHDVLTFPAS